jgi:hypothetical protein
VELVRASGAVLVTADFQARWLQSRAWLPRRPLLVAPVYSNLPPPREQAERGEGSRVLGVFGYAYQGAAMALVLDALEQLVRGGSDVRLALLGAPGRESAAAQELAHAARARGVAERVSFAGPLPAQELSDALARCDALVFSDQGGPSSRKGTLAGALASGAPVVALDGPRTWPELRAGRPRPRFRRSAHGACTDRARRARAARAGAPRAARARRAGALLAPAPRLRRRGAGPCTRWRTAGADGPAPRAR